MREIWIRRADLVAPAVAVVLASAVAAPAHATDRAAEIARIHVEAIGGRERVAALTALRMRGVVTTGTREVAVTLWAQRPARLRAEMEIEGRTIVQATDGVAPPWQLDPRAATTVARMSAETAERFLIDAEFDDPLVRGTGSGRRLEFAGEVDVGGRTLLRVLAVRSLTENVFVLVDPATHFIVFRVQELKMGPMRVEVVTRYEDYRPVKGVLVPHGMELSENGVPTQRVRFETIDGNPEVTERMFRMPVAR